MATKQFLTLEGLTTYDGLIKQYIGTEDAKSIKSLTVSGNTVSFYKTADASGTAAYTVNMPDVSGFMEKISGALGDKIVITNSDGSISEYPLDPTDIATGYAVSQKMDKIGNGTAEGGKIAITTTEGGVEESNAAIDNLMPKGDWSLHGYVVGTSTNGEVYDTEVGVGALEDAIGATTGFDGSNTIASALADKIDVIANATGGKIVTSTAQGEVAESGTAIADLATNAFVGSIPAGATATTVVGYIDEAVADAADDKMDKIASPAGSKITVSDANGGVVESALTVADVTGKMDKIASATGGKLVTSTSAGQVAESNTAIADLATQSDLDNLMPRGDWTPSEEYNVVPFIDENGTLQEGYPVGSDGLLTGYFGEAGPGTILCIDGSADTRMVGTTGLTIDDIARKDSSKEWGGNKVLMSDSEGQIAESGTAISDLATQSDIASFLTGYDYTNSQDKILICHGDASEGDIEVSLIDINDVADAITAVNGKMAKGTWSNNELGRIVLTERDGEVSYGPLIGQSDNDGLFVLTGYGYTPVPGHILIFDNPTNGGLVDDSGVALSDLATKAFVGSIPQGASASTVVGYIDEAVADAAADADISLVEAQTPTTGYLKTYELYQGGNAAANLVGKIDIPKDLVVTSGEIVVNPAGQPAGTYLKLTIANQTAPVYINVADLCDVYTAQQSAAQVQLAISATNEISATIVAGSVTATELASNAVTTAKIANDAVTADKVSIAAHSEIQTAAAANGNVALTVTTTDGQVSAVSASIPANTYDAYGAASGVQTALVGASSDPASADTINGAKAYADAATASIPTSSIEALFA